MKIIAMAGVAALVLSAPLAVSAQPLGTSQDETTVVVRTTAADLDLNQPEQARVALDRINRAALEACGASEFSAPEYRAAVQASECYDDGVQQAVAQLNAPELDRLYHRRGRVEVQPGS